MDVGVGLPTTIRGVTRMQLLEWARRADARGFSSLGTIDRPVYGNLEPLMALAAAAAVTERIRLATNILIAPYRLNGALAAKRNRQRILDAAARLTITIVSANITRLLSRSTGRPLRNQVGMQLVPSRTLPAA